MSTQDSAPPVRIGVVSALDEVIVILNLEAMSGATTTPTPFRPSFVDSYVGGDATPKLSKFLISGILGCEIKY